MGVSVQWDNTHYAALLYQFDPSWTWDEFDAAVHRANAIMSGQGIPVNILLDLRQCERLPRGVHGYFRRLDDLAVSFQTGNVVVARGEYFSELFWLYFWAIFRKTHHITGDEKPVMFVRSLREAYAIVDSVHA